jgi:gamma-glutamylcyclotransferase (GGCT)/AIG2-like uncharacterized protein YtfP
LRRVGHRNLPKNGSLAGSIIARTVLIFVYGTLRKGGVREMPALFPGAPDLGFGSVHGWLYDFGAYPGVLLDHAAGPVLGEVYDVDATMLARLDEIEEYFEDSPSTSYYFRVRCDVAMQDGRTLTCQVYEFNPECFKDLIAIPDGDWIAHAARKGPLPPERWPDGDPIER